MPSQAGSGLQFGLAIARDLFKEIGEKTFDGLGVTRDAYGRGEQLAHDIVAAAARDLDLEVEVDAALNTSVTLRARHPDAKTLLIGSHLDSVPKGGNYDGLAGVLAGLACLAGLRQEGASLPGNVTLVAFRSEENAWFSAQHIGSRAALGLLRSDVIQRAKRIDTGRTLADHMAAAGADLKMACAGRPLFDRGRVAAYLELHIEQGPVLDRAEQPIAIVSGIRGYARIRDIICRGVYGHSGAVPRDHRKDAVMAVTELITRMEQFWQENEERGDDLVLTFGQLCTDPSAHGVTIIPGQVTTCFDARSHSSRVLDSVSQELDRVTSKIVFKRNVSFEFSPIIRDDPIAMDAVLRQKLASATGDLGVESTELASGASHDAADFAAAGIPSAMIFVRNQNGSHNPAEAMRFEDFSVGVEVMNRFAREFFN